MVVQVFKGSKKRWLTSFKLHAGFTN